MTIAGPMTVGPTTDATWPTCGATNVRPAPVHTCVAVPPAAPWPCWPVEVPHAPLNCEPPAPTGPAPTVVPRNGRTPVGRGIAGVLADAVDAPPPTTAVAASTAPIARGGVMVVRNPV